jgi:hypothetical protein
MDSVLHRPFAFRDQCCRCPLHPGRATGLLGLPASLLVNQSVPLDLLWTKALNAQVTLILGKPPGSARLLALQTVLLRCLPRAGSIDEMVKAAIEWLAGHPEGHVEELGRWTGIRSSPNAGLLGCRCRLRRSSAYDARGRPVFRQSPDGIVEFRGMYFGDVRFLQDADR